MPQPKSGRITRSPGEVDSIVQIDWRMPSSPEGTSSIWPPSSRPTGKFQPSPRKPLSAIGSADHHGAGRDYLARREINRVVAGESRVSVAGSGLAVDHHGWAARLHRGLVRRWPRKAGAWAGRK